ncbi:hypothetical protein SLEP1_g49312 [Rubroshorea leprosula]|uniref:Uncharacterized protein n=1 Tax=Rubroshorea leprosula TaxID=152421 RepID=A0AAV5LYH4_9ROSI|nr:hypothetical protein SLEP1_g49312 [Rubroshorea leprosula]
MGIIAFTAAISALGPPTCIDKGNCIDPKEWQLGVLFVGLGLLAIGAGGIGPCNIAFGADQFDTTTKKGRRQLDNFFNWWFDRSVCCDCFDGTSYDKLSESMRTVTGKSSL